jgi:hypothetical protein
MVLKDYSLKGLHKLAGLPPDLDGINYATHLEVAKAERYEEGVFMHVISCIKVYQTPGKRQTHVFGQGLLLKQRHYDHCYWLQICPFNG